MLTRRTGNGVSGAGRHAAGLGGCWLSGGRSCRREREPQLHLDYLGIAPHRSLCAAHIDHTWSLMHSRGPKGSRLTQTLPFPTIQDFEGAGFSLLSPQNLGVFNRMGDIYSSHYPVR